MGLLMVVNIGFCLSSQVIFKQLTLSYLKEKVPNLLFCYTDRTTHSYSMRGRED